MQRTLGAALEAWLGHRQLRKRDWVLAALLRLSPVPGAPVPDLFGALRHAPRKLGDEPRRGMRAAAEWDVSCGDATIQALSFLRSNVAPVGTAHPCAVASEAYGGLTPDLVDTHPPIIGIDDCHTDAEAVLFAVQVSGASLVRSSVALLVILLWLAGHHGGCAASRTKVSGRRACPRPCDCTSSSVNPTPHETLPAISQVRLHHKPVPAYRHDETDEQRRARAEPSRARARHLAELCRTIAVVATHRALSQTFGADVNPLNSAVRLHVTVV